MCVFFLLSFCVSFFSRISINSMYEIARDHPLSRRCSVYCFVLFVSYLFLCFPFILHNNSNNNKKKLALNVLCVLGFVVHLTMLLFWFCHSDFAFVRCVCFATPMAIVARDFPTNKKKTDIRITIITPG